MGFVLTSAMNALEFSVTAMEAVLLVSKFMPSGRIVRVFPVLLR